jgi:hypothetical protein
LIAEEISLGALESRLSFKRKASLSLLSDAQIADRLEKHGTMRGDKK